MNKDKVLFAELSGAQVHDSKMAQPMMQILNTRSIDRFVADRGYDDKLRTWLNFS